MAAVDPKRPFKKHLETKTLGGIMRSAIPLLAFFLVSAPAWAHHSRAEYDDSVTKLSGTIERVQWKMPHVRFILSVLGEDGVMVRWNLESRDVNSLNRAGLPNNLVAVGSTVSVVGNVSTRRPHRMFVHNLLRADNLEIVFLPNSEPYWPEAERVVGISYPMNDPSVPGPPSNPTTIQADGIFRVWTPTRNNIPPAFANEPPFTYDGKIAYEAYDVVFDSPVLNCNPPGMPRLMTRTGTSPIEFVNEGRRILIRTTSFGLVREINLDANLDFGNEEPRPLGYSIGRWDGNTLTVTTTRIDWPYLSFYGFQGAPQSTDTVITERFHLDDDETSFEYDIIANDPVNFTEPVAANGYYVYEWRPDLQIKSPAECGLEFSD
jgi:hypothetical protein